MQKMEKEDILMTFVPARHQFCADQDPHLPQPEPAHNRLPLRLRAFGVNDINVHPVVHEFLVQLRCALFALHEHQHGKLQPLQWKTRKTETYKFRQLFNIF